MKKLTTVLCCIALALYGGFVANTNNSSSQTATAATIVENSIPYDFRLNHTFENKHDTVIIHKTDTVRVEVPKVVTRYKVKEVKVPYPSDTLNVVIKLILDKDPPTNENHVVTTDSLPNL